MKIYDFDALNAQDYKNIKEHLQGSGILIYPTETSYALGGNALDNEAVKKIYAIKGREDGKALPIIVKDLNMLLNIAKINRLEEDMISKFWPGPLTVVFNLKKSIINGNSKNYLFTAGSNSVAARISPHPFAARLFEDIEFPLVSTSANFSGVESFSDFSELNEKFLSAITKRDLNILAINAGELYGGCSTIIKIDDKNVKILREGDNNIKEKLLCSIKNK